MKRSFVKKTMRMLVGHLAIMLVVLVVYIVFSYSTANENLEKSAKNYIDLYGNELRQKLQSSESLLSGMVYNNSDYILLQSSGESERYYASVGMRNYMVGIITNDRYADFAVVTETMYGTTLMAENKSVSYEGKKEVKQIVDDYARNGQEKSKWSICEIAGRQYVCKMYSWRGRAAGIFMSLDGFMESQAAEKLEGMSILLIDGEGKLRGEYGDHAVETEIGSVPDEKYLSDSSHVFTLDGENLKLAVVIDRGLIVKQLTVGGIALFVILLASAVFGVLLFGMIRREILMPMTSLKDNMKHIEGGEFDMRIANDFPNEEFDAIKTSFNTMMDEIVDLKIEGYEKQLELQGSELGRIRMTLKPHFFLNALTTISSLSQQGKNDEVKLYIDALSKNLRYMFRSGLHTVELQEELAHIENYFEMQELRYPGCVFHYTAIDEGLEHCRIPQMILHTIIENEYKYAVSVDSMLSIIIRASLKEVDGEKMLQIVIEDDGKGYPEDIIESFNSDSIESLDGSRIGLWSLKKMLAIMYEREGLFTIGNTEPHGCANRFLIPAEPKHEVDSTIKA